MLRSVMMLRHGFLTAACLLLTAGLLRAQDAAAFARADESVKAEMQKQRIPGLAAAIIKDGRIAHVTTLGMANVEHQVPVKLETVFQSGSTGKQFTAAAIMLLVEDGKIGLDDRIAKYLPGSPPHWQNITIRHLLTHTAGTTDYPPDFDFRRDHTEEDLLRQAAAIPLAFQPGDRWSYSNLGYVMLGILISKVTGNFYGEFLKTRIFQPLGMSTARIINEADIIPNRAAGYRMVRGELKNQDWVSPVLNTTADGSLYLTLSDMAKWDAALYGEKLLKASSLKEMWTPVRLNNGKTYPYGFGWMLRDANGHRLIEHGGSWQGFRTQISRYVDDKLTIVVFANLAQSNPERIARAMAVACSSALVSEDDQAKGMQTSRMLRTVLSGGAVDGAIEDKPELRNRIQEVVRDLKPIGGIEAVVPGGRPEDDGIYSYRIYRIVGASGMRRCRVQLTQDSKIVALELLPQ